MSVEPAQLADDAAGRVELIVVRAPADVLEPAEPPAPDPAARPAGEVLGGVMSHGGWIAVGILAVVLVALFVVGLWFTH